MQSRWVDRDAKAAVDRFAAAGISPELALRVYTTRLLGGDAALVLHGGGNTSVKTKMRDLAGDEVEVLCIKGTGGNMGTIEPGGMAAVRLAPLQRLRTLDDLSDDDMARVQRAHLLDPMAPSPSLELLLHAFMPHKFVDHTHANAVLSLIDQPDGAKLCEEVYDGRVGLVPYVRPGFGLAKAAATTFDKNPKVEGAHSRQARHLQLRRERQGILRAHDRTGQPRRGAAEEEPQGGVQIGATAAAGAAKRRRGAFHPRRMQPERRRRRRRAPAHDSRIPIERRDPEFHQWRRVEALRRLGGDHAGLHDPHQEPAADRADAAGRQARRLQARGSRRRRGLYRQLQAVFRPSQCALRRRQEDGRSPAPHRAGAGARPLRARPLGQGRLASPPILREAWSR